MAKFDKVIPKEPWSAERTQQQITAVWDEVATLNRMINEIDSKMSGLIEEKMIVKKKISNKHKYIKQLKIQLEETEGWELLSDEQEDKRSVASKADSSNDAGQQNGLTDK